jgi:transcriptional regulator with XRE-family HTH domain
MAAKVKISEAEKRRRIGRRIRRRRLLLNMTQTALARALGVSFQQVQKYERGASPVPPSRLMRISQSLEVTPDYFSGNHAELADKFDCFVQSPEGISLYRAVSLIPDAAMRARLILAVAAFSDSQARPEDRPPEDRPPEDSAQDSETALLSAWLGKVARDGDSDRHKKNVAAGIRAAKVELAQQIGKTLKARKLTQKFAARILRTNQARISDLARGNVEATSFEKLLRYLVLLGWNARIAIARRPTHAGGRIEITSNKD